MIARAIAGWLAVLAVTACDRHDANTVDASTVDALPRQTVTMSETLAPGVVVEGSWNAGPSDEVGLSIDTTIDGLDWDIHAHADGGTQEVVAAFAQMTVSYDFRPTQQTQWYLLLRNSSEGALTLDIQMDMYGQAQWIGFQ